MNKITANYNEKRQEIYITGDFDKLNDCLQEFKLNEKLLIVSDTYVGRVYEEEILRTLNNREVYTYRMGVGENYKTLDTIKEIYDKCFQNGFNRASAIIALGGGVVGDTAGFAAGTYMRGIKFIQIPTTIIADVDSSIGGKVGVNHNDIKNLIGTFYHPEFIFINTSLLKTLEKRHIVAGIAEIIKYAVLYDEGFFNYLEQNAEGLLNLESDKLIYTIEKCIRFKLDSVKNDVYDKGERQLLNFGHSIGHVIESISNYSIYHGEAVAIGMMFECVLSSVCGKLSDIEVARVFKLIDRFGLNHSYEFGSLDNMFEIMRHDKKADRGIIRYIIPERIGKAVLVSAIEGAMLEETMSILRDYWKQYER